MSSVLDSRPSPASTQGIEHRSGFQALFAELGIQDPEVQMKLCRFIENGELDEEFAKEMNENAKIQAFIEKAFAREFEPLQRLLGAV
jgi:predicted SnoaL-like aldol condensation-catalyzing enzyme